MVCVARPWEQAHGSSVCPSATPVLLIYRARADLAEDLVRSQRFACGKWHICDVHRP